MILAALLSLRAFAAPEELDIYAHSPVKAARRALEERLLAEGYREGRSGDGYTVYWKPGAGHPKLIVYDDGWVRTRRQSVAARFVSQWPGGDASGRPVRFEFSGPRVGAGNTARGLDAIQPQLRALNAAVAAEAMDERESYDIPEELERIWAGPEPAEVRRAALLAWWDERTDTPEGERARRAVERFIAGVVQASGTPFTQEEIDAFNQRSAHPFR